MPMPCTQTEMCRIQILHPRVKRLELPEVKILRLRVSCLHLLLGPHVLKHKMGQCQLCQLWSFMK